MFVLEHITDHVVCMLICMHMIVFCISIVCFDCIFALYYILLHYVTIILYVGMTSRSLSSELRLRS